MPKFTSYLIRLFHSSNQTTPPTPHPHRVYKLAGFASANTHANCTCSLTFCSPTKQIANKQASQLKIIYSTLCKAEEERRAE